MFSILKSVNKQDAEKEIEELLEKVNLTHVADKQVQTFSGGMKRRLSVAISAVGDPKIIYFDEPSTGLDPVKKFHIMQNFCCLTEMLLKIGFKEKALEAN